MTALDATVRIRAVSFDLDGTLIVGTSDVHLARELGFVEEVLEWDRLYVSGKMSSREFEDKEAERCRGRKKADLVNIMSTLPKISGIRETVDRLHSEGIIVLAGTIAWDFVSEHFKKEYGFDEASSSAMGQDCNGILDGTIAKHFDEYDKALWVEEVCRNRGISMAEVAAVGDSRSDIPLFEKVGLAIALNGTPKLREVADLSFVSDDLSVVVEPILAGSRKT